MKKKKFHQKKRKKRCKFKSTLEHIIVPPSIRAATTTEHKPALQRRSPRLNRTRPNVLGAAIPTTRARHAATVPKIRRDGASLERATAGLGRLHALLIPMPIAAAADRNDDVGARGRVVGGRVDEAVDEGVQVGEFALEGGDLGLEGFAGLALVRERDLQAVEVGEERVVLGCRGLEVVCGLRVRVLERCSTLR